MTIPARRTIPLLSFDGILTQRDPFAVPRFVVFGVIFPAKRKTFRTPTKRRTFRAWTHISQKIDELLPAPTHPDSASTVVFKAWTPLIGAPGFHVCPDAMGPGSFKSVFPKTIACNFVPQTSATAVRTIANKAACFNFDNSAAVTLASPKSDSISAWRSCNDQETSRTNASQVMDLHL